MQALTICIAQVWGGDLSGYQHAETGEGNVFELLEDVAVLSHEDPGLFPRLPLPGQLRLVHHHPAPPLSPVSCILASWQAGELSGAAEICQLQRRADLSRSCFILPHQIWPTQLGRASARALPLVRSLPPVHPVSSTDAALQDQIFLLMLDRLRCRMEFQTESIVREFSNKYHWKSPVILGGFCVMHNPTILGSFQRACCTLY